jgi:hypothetical protein
MKPVVEVFVQVPTSWTPPFVENDIEFSEIPLQFRRLRSWSDPNKFVYICKGCLSAGGEIEDIYRTEPFSEEEDDEITGLPLRIKTEITEHARQHEIIWRWAFNRISAKAVCK